MLSKIITKQVSRRIISVLLEKNASLSEIASISKTTKANISHTLSELEQEDIVRKEIRGRTHIYRFNFLHVNSKEVLQYFLRESQEQYMKKMNNLPKIVNNMLIQILNKNYEGCIFFGSSINQEYKDIDIFVIAKNIKVYDIQKRLQQIHTKISVTLGTTNEISKGIENEDMLFKNIINGVPYGCEEFIINLRHNKYFLQRKDITERFIIGYREILSCLNITEKEYVTKHLDKGIMDIVYASLAYFEQYPHNDKDAKKMFKEKFKFSFSESITKAKIQA